MSDGTATNAASPLLFPAVLYGDTTTCRRKMKAEAKKWAKLYKERGEFPEPALVAIPPGSVVFVDENTANFVGDGYSLSSDRTSVTINTNANQENRHSQWRLYMIDKLEFETSQAVKVPHAERFIFRRAYISFVCRYPWGALAAATERCLFNTIEFTIPRIEGVLRFWEPLDTLKYVFFYQRPMSLADLMVFYFEGHVAMWVDRPTGNITTDLRTAIDAMHAASQDEIWGRLVKRLRAYADTAPRLEHRDWLTSPGVIEAAIEVERGLGRECYEDLTTGELGKHVGFLSHLARKYPGTMH